MRERVIPAAGHLVVLRDPTPGMVGDLYLPDTVTAAKKTCTGRVLACGTGVVEVLFPDAHDQYKDLLGSKVIFDLFVGTSISRDNVRVNDDEVILKAEDVLGIVVDSES